MKFPFSLFTVSYSQLYFHFRWVFEFRQELSSNDLISWRAVAATHSVWHLDKNLTHHLLSSYWLIICGFWFSTAVYSARSVWYRRRMRYRVYWFNRGSFVCGESEFIREFIFVILDFKTRRSSSFKQFSWRIKCVFIQRHSRTFNPESHFELKWPSR